MPNWTPRDFAKAYLILFHMAGPGSWPNIERLGLLSTASLLDKLGRSKEEKERLTTRRRPDSVTLEHAKYGRVVLRDQKPLSEAKLAKCLTDGLTVADWLRLLNMYVFFWVEPGRLSVLREARAYRQKRHTVIKVDTSSLLRKYQQEAWLTDRNTGATRFIHLRGANTFVRLEMCDRKRRVVELAVRGGILDISQHVIAVEEVGDGEKQRVIYSR